MTIKKSSNILVISPERIGEKMAGPAIRALELARALSRHLPVTLAAPGEHSINTGPSLSTTTLELSDFGLAKKLIASHDVVVAQVLPLKLIKQLRTVSTKLVFDLYDPTPLEALEFYKDYPLERQRFYQNVIVADLIGLMAAADFIICASEKQRDLWLGGLLARGLLDPAIYAVDPTYRTFIDVVPFGIPEAPPKKTAKVLKGVWPGIRSRDKVVLWGGGIWDWFDPMTAIKAVERLAAKRSDIKLFFLGVRRPKAGPPIGAAVTERCVAYAQDKGLDGKTVFFNYDWVPYAERANYLLDADIGISTHYDHLETQYSFRTRILDYLWAELPVVTTVGDSLADLVGQRQLGQTVSYENVPALAGAITALLDDKHRRSETIRRIRKLKPEFTWPAAISPLVRFCQEQTSLPARRKDYKLLGQLHRRQYPRHLRMLYEEQGPGALAAKALRKPLKVIRRK